MDLSGSRAERSGAISSVARDAKPNGLMSGSTADGTGTGGSTENPHASDARLPTLSCRPSARGVRSLPPLNRGGFLQHPLTCQSAAHLVLRLQDIFLGLALSRPDQQLGRVLVPRMSLQTSARLQQQRARVRERPNHPTIFQGNWVGKFVRPRVHAAAAVWDAPSFSASKSLARLDIRVPILSGALPPPKPMQVRFF